MVCRTTHKLCHVRLREALGGLKASLDAVVLVLADHFLETARGLADMMKAVDMRAQPKTLRSGVRRCEEGYSTPAGANRANTWDAWEFASACLEKSRTCAAPGTHATQDAAGHQHPASRCPQKPAAWQWQAVGPPLGNTPLKRSVPRSEL